MDKGLQRFVKFAFVLVTAGLAAAPALCWAADDSSANGQHPAPPDSGLYLKVQLSKPVKMSRLKPGDVIEGNLSRDVYSTDRILFPAASSVRLIVDHMEKRRRTPNDHWPWVVKAFAPRHENYPVFKVATITQAEGESSLPVSLIAVSRLREVHAKAKKSKSGQRASAEDAAVEVSRSNARRPAAPTMVLEAVRTETAPSAGNDEIEASSPPDFPASDTLPAGTHCKILLLGNVSASKSKAGDLVEARLLEPVLLNSKVVLPAGSFFQGKVVKATPPRWLSRAGSLHVIFTGLTARDGSHVAISASLAGAELDQRSHTRIDAEGGVRGERAGKAWMAINVGMSVGISKEVDDGMQLLVEALVSTATDASTAGTARIVSSCASAIYMATRHGRDVILPRFTEMDIALDRPVSVSTAERVAPATASRVLPEDLPAVASSFISEPNE